LPPVTVVGAHLTPLLQKAMGDVNGRIEGVKAENVELAKRIEEQNREMEELRKVLEGKMEELEKAVEEVVVALEDEGDEMVGVERTG
jgi:predicted  nucleic acid-binding Zn-ribbon protein